MVFSSWNIKQISKERGIVIMSCKNSTGKILDKKTSCVYYNTTVLYSYRHEYSENLRTNFQIQLLDAWLSRMRNKETNV